MSQLEHSRTTGDQGAHQYPPPEALGEQERHPGFNPDEILNVTNQQQLSDALSAIRAMTGSTEASNSKKLPDPFAIEDWSGIDAKSLYGVTETENGWKIDRVPGLNGKAYSVVFERDEGGTGFTERVYQVGADGELKEVTTPYIAVPAMRTADLIHRVSESQAVLANPEINEAQHQILDSLVQHISEGNDDMDQLVKDYLEEGGTFKEFVEALKAAAVVKGLDDAVIEYKPNVDYAQELRVTFPLQDEVGYTYRFDPVSKPL